MNQHKEKPTIIKLSANADDAQKYKAQASQLGLSRSDFLLGLIEGQQRYPSFAKEPKRG